MKQLIVIILVLAAAFTGYRVVESDQEPQHTAAGSSQVAADKPMLVNKNHPLSPLSYAPNHLVEAGILLRDNITDEEKYTLRITQQALVSMISAADKQGVKINLQSGYRSYQSQTKLYEVYTKLQGETDADKYSAKPGYSEHQTGLAVDLGSIDNPDCNLRVCFADTDAAQWLHANAYRYGFILRYPKNKTSLTGYEYEPWHFRYVGKVVASTMQDERIATLEEYVGSR